MKLLKASINGLSRFGSPLEIDFFAQQRVAKEAPESLYEFYPGLYTDNLIAFIGLNASGKTSILKVLSFVFDFLNCTPINNSGFRDVLNGSSEIVLETYFAKEEYIYKLHSVITAKDEMYSSVYEIKDEYLMKKNTKCLKKDIFVFNENSVELKRDASSEFLKNDISIILSLNKNSEFKVRNLIEFTNNNVLPIIGQFPKELISFLDPTIEEIRYTEGSFISIKFYHRKEIIMIQSPKQLMNYLSSGTIKGISVFINAMITFQEGGYLLIDELENHFNHEIVATLVRFFTQRSVNANGGTLVFTTHYPELLDIIDRAESIYLVRNYGEITAKRLNYDLSRNDLKKSEIYISDFLGGTAPSYETYMALKKAMMPPKAAVKNYG